MGTEEIPNSENSGNVSELEQKIIRQVEYYFGNFNLCKDKFLREQVKVDDGWVPLDTMVKFNRLKNITQDFNVICEALKKSPNDLLEVNEDSTKIRRRVEKPIPDDTYAAKEVIDERSLYVKGFRKNVTLDELLEFFKEHKAENIHMRQHFHHDKKSFRGSCFVIFEAKDDADKFLDAKGLKFENTELLKERKKDYVARKDIYYANLRAEKEKKLQKKAESQKDDEKEVPEPEVIPGCLLKITGLGSDCSREDIKTALASHGTVVYVDYFRGNPEGIVRFDTGVAPEIVEKAEEEDGERKFLIGSSKATISVVEGDSEKEYWKSITVSRANARQRFLQNSKQKGRFNKNKNWGKRGSNRSDRSNDKKEDSNSKRAEAEPNGDGPSPKKAKIESNEDQAPKDVKVDTSEDQPSAKKVKADTNEDEPPAKRVKAVEEVKNE